MHSSIPVYCACEATCVFHCIHFICTYSACTVYVCLLQYDLSLYSTSHTIQSGLDGFCRYEWRTGVHFQVEETFLEGSTSHKHLLCQVASEEEAEERGKVWPMALVLEILEYFYTSKTIAIRTCMYSDPLGIHYRHSLYCGVQ